MELKTEKQGNALIIHANGRLDASWSDYFADCFEGYIRQGEHILIIDAAGISFLSSAGIRSLVKIHKELSKLKGKFTIVNANDFVVNTLRMTGFGIWLSDGSLPSLKQVAKSGPANPALPENCFLLHSKGAVSGEYFNGWKPFDGKDPKQYGVEFNHTSFALGIGSPAQQSDQDELVHGDFLVVCGHFVYQRPEVKSRPDFILCMDHLKPKAEVVQYLGVDTELSHLFRFNPKEDGSGWLLSQLAVKALEITGSSTIVFVILAESDGLVGVSMIKSLTQVTDKNKPEGLALRDWLSYSTERIFTHEQALVIGFASRGESTTHQTLMVPSSSFPGLWIHAHATVFPYQPLQNGQINLNEQVEKFLNGPPPKALLHLIDDSRPSSGLGESAFIRGALWFTPIKSMEEKI